MIIRYYYITIYDTLAIIYPTPEDNNNVRKNSSSGGIRIVYLRGKHVAGKEYVTLPISENGDINSLESSSQTSTPIRFS